MEITITIPESAIDDLVPAGPQLREYPYGATCNDIVVGCRKLVENYEDTMILALVVEINRRAKAHKKEGLA